MSGMNWLRAFWLAEKIKREVEMDKMWYASRTLWVNVLAVIAIVLQGQFGYVLTPELQMTALGVVNVILRGITKKAINWT